MKNKLFLVFVTVFFAAIAVFNLTLSQHNAAGDITLAGVEMMASAYSEGDDDWKDHCDPVWTNNTCKVGNIIHTYMKPKD